MHQAKISPRLKQIYEKGNDGKRLSILLTDGRCVECRLEMLTYANRSDDDDSDIMVALVRYDGGDGELLAEEDIKEVL